MKSRNLLKNIECNGKLCLYSNERQVLLLRKLTFDSIMDFYGKHNRTVFQRILEAQRSGTLSPFVGAGLSVPFGYKQWGGVLKELAENILDEDKKALILCQIKNCQYEEAAGTILAEYPFMLDQLPDIVSPDILTKCSEEKKRSSAAWVLPYLFRRELVMTTNFDRCLEECYLSHQNTAIPTVTPVMRDRLAQLQLNQELCLLKLHGDIGKEAVSIDDLVFTLDQYKEHYAEGSSLVSVLIQRFSTRRMLFLGCSLSSDRTMKVLEQVVKTQKGIRHFAILGCKKSEIPTRMKALQALGILPIFYDDSNHDAVRVILERLLEETDQPRYQRLVRDSRVAPPVDKAERSLLFDADFFAFSGREVELQCLERFCSISETCLWWVVTGPGGMGKSRLVYEFCRSMQKKGWHTLRFEAHPTPGSAAHMLTELTDWQPDAKKTIVVLDDVQAHTETVFKWLSGTMRRHRSEPLRVLLLEREGTCLSDATWMSPNFHGTGLEDWCPDRQFLRLDPMDNDALMTVMENYAKAAGKTLNSPHLLKSLGKIDPKLKRPLYAVAIADAQCRGQNPAAWNREKILDTLTRREIEFHFNRFRSFGSLNQTLSQELERLLAEVCIYGPYSPDKLNLTQFKHLSRYLDDSYMSSMEFYGRLGLLRTVSDQQVLTLSCPDLIREHLVLDLYEQGRLDLLPDGWADDVDRLYFLTRLWMDYPSRIYPFLQANHLFGDRFFKTPPPSGPAVENYGALLWLGIYHISNMAEQFIHKLATWYDSCQQNPEIALAYAKGLFNLSFVQKSPQEWATIIRYLKTLYDAHPNTLEIALRYANVLFNLSCVQETMQARSDTVNRLKELYEAHSNTPEIALTYAQGLFNLTCLPHSSQECANTLHLLKSLYYAHVKNPDILTECAYGLVNLACDQQSAQDCTDIIQHLAELYNDNQYHPEIALSYAIGLFVLTQIMEEADISGTLDSITVVLRIHPDLIPRFRDRLDKYLSEHPDHTARYHPLLELGGDNHA